LNAELLNVFKQILSSVDNYVGKSVFLDVPEEAEETRIIKLLLANLRSENVSHLQVPLSGIVLNLPEG